MKLQAGVKKVVLTDEEAARENVERASNRGRIFKPTFVIYCVSPNGEKATRYDAYTFKAKTLTPRSCVGPFPFPWASTELRSSTHVWFETEGEVDIVTTQPEDL